MSNIDSQEPIFELHTNGKLIAKLCAPQWEDMYWCSYRIYAVDAESVQIIRNLTIWETANFTIKTPDDRITHEHTICGDYIDFCNRTTDRLLFRSLWPVQPKRYNSSLDLAIQKLCFWKHWKIK